MKVLLAVTTIMILSISTLAAQDKAKLIAVFNKADWCPTCEKHGERAMTALMKANMDANVSLISNDVTNDETKKSSVITLEKAGLDKESISLMKSTGVIYFFNTQTKELISSISMSKNDTALVNAMEEAVNR